MFKLLGPYITYIKWGLIASAIAGAAYLSHATTSALAEKAKIKAVDNAVKEAQKALDEERAKRAAIQQVANERQAALILLTESILSIREGIQLDLNGAFAADRKFYSQKLPDGGYEQWKRARALTGASPASSPVSTPR